MKLFKSIPIQFCLGFPISKTQYSTTYSAAALYTAVGYS